MADRPIIFSAPMVRALSNGIKTQTRRVLKPDHDTLPNGFAGVRLPYAPGDRLYVREAWAPNEVAPGEPIYRADYGQANGVQVYRLRDGSCEVAVSRWRPSIHMPRWASRLTLTVTEVRVQRLQEISAEDCTAEGIPWEPDALAPYEWSVSRFADLWNSLHGREAWGANPLVVAVSFTVRNGNIDMERKE